MQFNQPDTLIPEPYNPQAWNRYSYSLNNPIRYNDPSGHWVETAFDVISLGMSINDIRNEGWTVMNTISLVTDVAAIALPVIPAGASHLIRAAKYGSKAVNAVDTAADTAKVVDKTYTVYRSVKNGITEYVGITMDFGRRRDEHKLIGRIIEPIKGLSGNLSKYDAHAVEQVLIEKFGRIDKEVGGALSNIKNSISPKRGSYYEEAIGHGVQLLDELAPNWNKLK